MVLSFFSPLHNKIFPSTFSHKKFLTLFQKIGHNGNTQKGKKESIVLVTHGNVLSSQLHLVPVVVIGYGVAD